MPANTADIVGFLGILFRALGFLVFGVAAGRMIFDSFKESEWQVKIALSLGLLGTVIGLTHFASPGSAGAFALGAGVASFMSMTKKS